MCDSTFKTVPSLGESEQRREASRCNQCPILIAALRALFPDYSPTHLICAVQTVTMMWAPSVTLAERKGAQKAAPVFMYMLAWETPVARGSACRVW